MADLSVFSPDSKSTRRLLSESVLTSRPTPAPCLEKTTPPLAVFRRGRNWFGVDLTSIEHIVSTDYLIRLGSDSGARSEHDDSIVGTVGIRGRLVSVIDLPPALGLDRSTLEVSRSDAQPAGRSILISRVGGDEVGILVDDFIDTFFVPETDALSDSEPNRGQCRTIDAGRFCPGRTITKVQPQAILKALRHVAPDLSLQLAASN